MPMVEVECPNEKCPGREAEHNTGCICGGSGRVARDDGPGYEDCDAGEVTAERWMAKWINGTMTMEGHWDETIHCPRCSEEGAEL
jgi:hypothetical protein